VRVVLEGRADRGALQVRSSPVREDALVLQRGEAAAFEELFIVAVAQAVLVVVGRVELTPLAVGVAVEMEAPDLFVGRAIVIVVVDDETEECLRTGHAPALPKDRKDVVRRDVFEGGGRADEVHTAVGQAGVAGVPGRAVLDAIERGQVAKPS